MEGATFTACFVVHLPGDGAGLAGVRIVESQDLNRSGADRLSHRHARSAVGVHQQFDLAPPVWVEFQVSWGASR